MAPRTTKAATPAKTARRAKKTPASPASRAKAPAKPRAAAKPSAVAKSRATAAKAKTPATPSVAAKAKAPAKPRAAAKRKAPAKPPPARGTTAENAPPAPGPNLHDEGARVLSVFGTRGSRALVEMPTRLADTLFPDGLAEAARTDVIVAVEQDLAELVKRAPDLAKSALAASALALAYELQNPFNSATSKSMCARALADAMAKLREWAPPAEQKGRLDELKADRAARRAAGEPAT